MIFAVDVFQFYPERNFNQAINRDFQRKRVSGNSQYASGLNGQKRREKADGRIHSARECSRKRADENNAALDFSRPGKPTDKAFIESFNGSFRDECLNVNWFLSLADAKEKIKAFKEEYNHYRPHSAPGMRSIIEALEREQQTRNSLL